MPDPYAPEWRPEYTGEGPADVGSGADGFGAALYDLYKAGRLLLPGAATTYATASIQVHGLRDRIDAVFDLPGYYQLSYGLLKSLHGTVQDVLRLSSTHVRDTGVALVEIAARYASTDEAAAATFTRLMDDESEIYHP